ncbi:MAG: glycosyltransferase family 9 protein [Xanthomonadales bacterium]|nr:glycosyltransferase family 9 protein [Xanthomonadales bacterium]
MNSLPAPPFSICILRLSALGDATHVLPVIRCLQTHWPNTRLTWIIGKLEHRLMSGLQGVEMLEFDKRGGWGTVRQLCQQLKTRRFDVLLHMQVAARANLLSLMIKAPTRLGWNRARSRDFHHWFTNEQVANIPQQHQVEGFLEFTRALGLPAGPPVWNLPVTEEARDWAGQWLESDRPNIVISPCSSHVLRNWPAAHYAEIADFAIEQLGARILLSGGPGELERRTGMEIAQMMRHPCQNLIGRDTLEQSKALLQSADLLISPDSGPVHIANALGTPVLGLYAATWARRSGPFNSLHLSVDQFPQAARTFRGKAAEDLRWGTRIEVPGVMDLVTPAMVKKKLLEWHERSVCTRTAS